ncbi:MAG: hypothetical protein PPP58_02770 [Natronomonas sp.]
MAEPTTVDPTEHTVEELLERLEDGERLLVRTEILGDPVEVTLRFDGETYYCDTPTVLHEHDAADGMVECLENYGCKR